MMGKHYVSRNSRWYTMICWQLIDNGLWLPNKTWFTQQLETQPSTWTISEWIQSCRHISPYNFIEIRTFHWFKDVQGRIVGATNQLVGLVCLWENSSTLNPWLWGTNIWFGRICNADTSWCLWSWRTISTSCYVIQWKFHRRWLRWHVCVCLGSYMTNGDLTDWSRYLWGGMSYVVILAVFVFGGELLQKWKHETGCVRGMWVGVLSRRMLGMLGSHVTVFIACLLWMGMLGYSPEN